MGPFFMVFSNPIFALLSVFFQPAEDLHIQHRFAIPSITLFNTSILQQLTGADERQAHTEWVKFGKWLVAKILADLLSCQRKNLDVIFLSMKQI
jgi:hypothetical protein